MLPYNPGALAPHTGIYAVVSPRGRRTGIERAVLKDAPFPATPFPRQRYVPAERILNI